MRTSIWSRLFGKARRNSQRGRVTLQIEQLDERVLPSAATTSWLPAGVNTLWSNAANWNGGLPTSSKVVIFNGNGMGMAGCTYDNTVQAANQVVAGIQMQNAWGASLQLTGGMSLTVSASGEDNTGFKWSSGTLSQASASDVLIIASGNESYNQWSGGSITNLMALSNVYINNYSTLRITASASTLGSNIIIGQDGNGGCTLEFFNQASTLLVGNNAYIKVADTTHDVGPNKLLFSTDVTQGGTASKGLSTTSADTFIDNYGTIVRSGGGTYQIDLPIKNNTSYESYPATLDLQSNLWISGSSANKTAGYSVYQVAGKTILENTATLKCRGVLMVAGALQTYGTSTATISKDDGFSATLLTVQGGTINISISEGALGTFGTLYIAGDMSWTGGTYQARVNFSPTTTTLSVQGNLATTAGAHLSVSASVGVFSQTWDVITHGTRSGTHMTFDNGAAWTLTPETGKYSVTWTAP